MTINPALAELETCRAYIVKRACARADVRARRHAIVSDVVHFAILSLGTLAAVVSFLCS